MSLRASGSITICDMTLANRGIPTSAGLLEKLSRAGFLSKHWQKRPLFVPGAIPDCGAWLQPATLFELAARDDVASRLVMRVRNRWTVHHGPFKDRKSTRLNSSH